MCEVSSLGMVKTILVVERERLPPKGSATWSWPTKETNWCVWMFSSLYSWVEYIRSFSWIPTKELPQATWHFSWVYEKEWAPVWIARVYTCPHSNHVTSSMRADNLICHTTMCRNPINFLYNLDHVTLWCVEVGPVANAREGST